ncbi:MAG: hypothetical protein M0Q29_11135 [Thiopseudomonas sp.]|nr:hypothetical protein [Thiopseudomonas sp.]MCK9466424.1 hypothetical protein [Thiopseudomonas sp.]
MPATAVRQSNTVSIGEIRGRIRRNGFLWERNFCAIGISQQRLSWFYGSGRPEAGLQQERCFVTRSSGAGFIG